jgi:hypothetical protein
VSDFSNNLRVGDKVFDVELKLNGLVSIEREKDRLTSVIFDGFVKSKRRDVAGLRLIVNGKPEDVAPFDGELPALEQKPVRTGMSYHEPRQQMIHPRELMTPLMILQEREEEIKKEMAGLEDRFKVLRAESSRNLNAIAALTA